MESETYNRLKRAADFQYNLAKKELKSASKMYKTRMFFLQKKLNEYHELSVSDKLEYIPGWVRYAIEFKLKANQWQQLYGYADLLEYTCEQLFKKQDSDFYLESYGSMLPLTININPYLRNFNP